MKALIYKAPYKMDLEEIPDPVVKDGEVLIRVKSERVDKNFLFQS